MKSLLFVLLFFVLPWKNLLEAQSEAIFEAPVEKRISLFWQYCTDNLISDQDSASVQQFLDKVIEKAIQAKDEPLTAYAEYVKRCWKILFSQQYELNFPEGPGAALDLLFKTQSWASKNGYDDIYASCEYYIGQIYYRDSRYGVAFDHMLKADLSFEKIGYQNVPNASTYLYNLGLCFYRFQEYEKALQKFIEATHYQFFPAAVELNTLNSIGLIYVHLNQPDKALTFFRNTMNKASYYSDQTWLGIAAGNLGNVFLTEHEDDSALYYHRTNYAINGVTTSKAPEDAAKTALSIATVWVRKKELDSAFYYAINGKNLANRFITDSTERLEFNKRLLQVRIDYLKAKGEYRNALLLTDSLILLTQQLEAKLDSKILSRAVEKTESIAYADRLALLKSQNDLSQLRFYFMVATLLIVLILSAALFRDNWLRQRRLMQLTDKDKQILLTEKLRAEDGLHHAKELLTAYVGTMKEKTKLIDHLESELTDLKELATHPRVSEAITSSKEKLMSSTIHTDEEWQHFKNLFEKVYPGFSFRLRSAYPELSPAEIRFLYLTKLVLSSKDMASMLGISIDAVHKLRYRLRKKLNLDSEQGFETVLQRIDESNGSSVPPGADVTE